MSGFRFAAFALCAALLGAGPAVRLSAEQPAPAALAAAPTPEPELIAVVDVATRAERTLQRLRDIERGLSSKPALVAIEKALPERGRELAARAATSRELLQTQHTRRALDDLQFEWSRDARTLSNWRKTLTLRAAELEAIQRELAREAELWQRSGEHARGQKAPPEVDERIQETRRAIPATAQNTELALRGVLALQNRVAEDLVLATDVIEEMDAARSRTREGLLEPDAPPVWRKLPEAQNHLSLLDEIRASFARDWELMRTYAQQSQAGLIAIPFCFAAALAAGRALRRRVASWSDSDPALGRARGVFERPVAAALLVTWLCAILANPEAPSGARHVAGLLFLAPLLRILQVLVHPLLHPALYALATFSLVDRFRDRVAAVPRLERVILAIELFAALLFLIALLRQPSLRGIGGASARVLFGAGRLGAGLLGVALLATLAGYVDFGSLLGEGALGCAYLGVAVYACMRVLQVALRVALETDAAQRVQLLRRRTQRIRLQSDRLLRWAATALIAFGALELFDLRDPLFAYAALVLTTPLEIGTVGLSLGDLVAFAISIAASFALAGAVRALLEDEVFPRVSLPRGVPNALASASRYTILLLGFLFAVAAAGADLSRFAVLAGALGVGIGFGLQNVVNNFISGLILLFERPVQVGDQIEVGGVIGEVRRIGIRSSTIRTFQGAEVIVPNANLISEQLVNWTLSDRQRRIELPVGVAYGNEPERVIEILLGVARTNPELLSDPEPVALFTGFGASSLDFELRAWTANFQSFPLTRSSLATAVHRALAEAGIQIPFPQQDLHLKSVSPGVREQLR